MTRLLVAAVFFTLAFSPLAYAQEEGALASLAQGDDPGFAGRLRRAGGYLVVDGRAVAALCGGGA